MAYTSPVFALLLTLLGGALLFSLLGKNPLTACKFSLSNRCATGVRYPIYY
jgi:ABC-type uncharacterized transport system permease subunit